MLLEHPGFVGGPDRQRILAEQCVLRHEGFAEMIQQKLAELLNRFSKNLLNC